MTLVLATANPHKTEEIRALLHSLDIEVLARPAELPDVEETCNTLEGNALMKATAIASATGLAALADDTGLFVDALGGRPGVMSARYAGAGASYEDNVRKLLDELEGVPAPARSAHFRTVMVVAYANGEHFRVEGVLDGVIADAPRGKGGFGYDPVFIVDPVSQRTLAELSLEEKNLISHRGAALRALVEALVRR
ncbi:MAG TPA: RdgB/HAM1 family non-canonical purine NTP pyrophosphatase [Acidimicrobiales bacterium]|nr:RdgB/HAM1 family non-canonical purine NTP pyrophosphatase [Acidimicrobiales bacterium]